MNRALCVWSDLLREVDSLTEPRNSVVDCAVGPIYFASLIYSMNRAIHLLTARLARFFLVRSIIASNFSSNAVFSIVYFSI